MDGSAVLAAPSLDTKPSDDLDDLVLELDEADINGPDSSTDANDCIDVMKAQDSPLIEKTEKSLSNEPLSECKDPIKSATSSMNLDEGIVNTDESSIKLNSEPNVGHSENLRSIKEGLSIGNIEKNTEDINIGNIEENMEDISIGNIKENAENISTGNIEGNTKDMLESENPLQKGNSEVEKTEVSSSDKPKVTEIQEEDNFESVDKELDSLLNNEESSPNVEIKREEVGSETERSDSIPGVNIDKIFTPDDIVIKSEEIMIDDVFNVNELEELNDEVENTLDKSSEKESNEEPMEVCLEESKKVDSEETKNMVSGKQQNVDLEKPQDVDLEKPQKDNLKNEVENEDKLQEDDKVPKDQKAIEKDLVNQVDDKLVEQNELAERIERDSGEPKGKILEKEVAGSFKNQAEKAAKKQVKQKKNTENNVIEKKADSLTKGKGNISNEDMDKDLSMDEGDFSMDGGDSMDSFDDLGGYSDESSVNSTKSKPHKTQSDKVVIKKKGKNKRLAERDFNDAPKRKKYTVDDVDEMVDDMVKQQQKKKKTVNGFKNGIESDCSSDDNVTKVNENLGKKNKSVNKSVITSRKKSFENPEPYMTAREKLAAIKDLNSRPLTVDGNMMEEMVMMKVVEYLAIGEQNEHRLDYASLMKKCTLLENSLLQIHKKSQDLTKQVEDCKHIIKKLIEERVANKACLTHTMPLRVTRSVGLQVCTVGSVNMVNTSRSKDLESVRKLLAASNSKILGVDDDMKDDVLLIEEDPIKEESTDKPQEKRVSDVERTQVTSSKSTSQSVIPSGGKLSYILQKPNKSAPDSSSMDKKTAPKVSACIDLTDNDDVPEKPDNEKSKLDKEKSKPDKEKPKPSQTSGAGGGTVKPPSSDVKSAEKKVNGEIKEPASKTSTATKMARKSTSGGTSKKSSVSPAGAELVNSFEQLPKFPPTPKYGLDVIRPPKPILRIGRNNSGKQGIMLSWNFDPNKDPSGVVEYQLYAFQETKSSSDKPDTWKKVGDIKALPLPMACFLTQFVEGHKYHFIVRAVDGDKKVGEFSMPGSIILQSSGTPTTSPTTTTTPSATT